MSEQMYLDRKPKSYRVTDWKNDRGHIEVECSDGRSFAVTPAQFDIQFKSAASLSGDEQRSEPESEFDKGFRFGQKCLARDVREAAAFRWMSANYFGADFHYGDEDNPVCVLTIRLPENAKGVSADLLLTVEAQPAAPPPEIPDK